MNVRARRTDETADPLPRTSLPHSARSQPCRGAMSVRDLTRSFAIWHWEIEAMNAVPEGRQFAGKTIPPVVEAYLRTYPRTQNRAAGRAGASRLMQHSHVRSWDALVLREAQSGMAKQEPMANTASQILAGLAELGCWRTKHV
jgi:hypothetical protein